MGKYKGIRENNNTSNISAPNALIRGEVLRGSKPHILIVTKRISLRETV
jgi:hypothetical protein